MEINSSQYVPCDTSCIGEWPSCPQDPQLALAYVPYQKADKVYRPKDALRQGTIFPELYMPYMEVPSTNLHDEDSLLYALMAHDFTLIDCELYLDTHPNDTRALKLYKECKQKRDTIRQMYVEEFGPLVHDDALTDDCSWTWVCSPWPWEYNANRSV